MAQSSVDIEKLNDLVDSLKKECKELQFKLAVHTLGEILTEIPGMRSSVKELKNAILSIEEGLDEGVLSKAAALRDLQTDLLKFLKNYDHLISDLASKKPAMDEVLYQAMGNDQLKVYNGSMDMVQKAISKSGVFTGYLPILPLTGPPLDATKLKRAGIPAEAYAGYTILTKQFVAGISMDYIRSHTEPDVGSVKKHKTPANAETPEKILQEFREVIQHRFAHLRLQEMVAPMSWWGATWFWFASERELNIWKKCTINETTVTSLKVSKWSFPFAKR